VTEQAERWATTGKVVKEMPTGQLPVQDTATVHEALK
jgi:hypothetical protein